MTTEAEDKGTQSAPVDPVAPVAPVVDRKVKPQKIKGAGAVGGWEIVCKNCPVLPHLLALGQKPQSCIAGIQDSCGVVPLNACKYIPGKDMYERANRIKDDPKTKSLVIPCGFVEGGLQGRSPLSSEK